MLNSYNLFLESLEQTKAIFDIHNFLEQEVRAPIPCDDLLRSQLVYAVSAFDKLIHDLVRVGMVEIFNGHRQPTGKYASEVFSLEVYNSIKNATTFPPPDYYFEQAVIQKLKIVSYQDPKKVADGLSYVWAQSQKWQHIGAKLGLSDKEAKTRLKLIADRRNMIVHESDVDPVNGGRHSISVDEVKSAITFIEKCGGAIYELVK